MCPPLVFPNFSQAQFDALAEKAKTAGVAIVGNFGQAAHDGATIKWIYNPEGEFLTLQCLSKPFLVSCDYVNNKLKELVGIEDL